MHGQPNIKKMEMFLQTLIRSPFNYMTNQWVWESMTGLYDVIQFFVWFIKK